MLMKTRLISILLMLASLASFAQNANDKQQEFEQELKSKNENVTSIKCSFTQTREVSVLANTVKKEGVYYFQRPGNMLLEFNDGDFIKMTEKWFEMNTAGNITTTKVTANPMLKNLNAILTACVAGNFEEMGKGFTIDLEEKENEWIVTLMPKRGKAASKIDRILIHFDKKDMSLNNLNMIEKTGDYTMYTFYQKEFNIAIDNQLFNTSK